MYMITSYQVNLHIYLEEGFHPNTKFTFQHKNKSLKNECF